jgi:tetratricopeptide (TPR) repeat protein
VGSAALTACGLLSQEGAVVLVPVLPLTAWFCTKSSLKSIGVSWLPVLAAAGVVLFVRQMVVAGQDERWAQMLVNNPYAGLSWWESFPTKTAILGEYLLMCVCGGLKLSYEYGYNQLPILSWGAWQFWIALLLHLTMLGYALWRTPRKDPAAYCLLVYLLSMSVASNYIVYYGMPMSDRMLYLGTLIVPSVFLITGTQAFMPSSWRNIKVGIVLFAALFVFKTVMRLPAWQSDFMLFTGDVNNAPNCLRARVNAAQMLLDSAAKLSTVPANDEKRRMTTEAASHLRAALAIDSTAMPKTYILLASTVSTPDSALSLLRRATALDPVNTGYRAAALMTEAQILLSNNNGDTSRIDSALALHRAALPLVERLPEPRRSSDRERIYGTMGMVAMQRSDYAAAEDAFEQALRANPSNEAIRTNIAIARFNASFQLAAEYERRGQIDSAVAQYERALATNVRSDVAAAELARLRSRR